MEDARNITTRSDALAFAQEYCDFSDERVYVFELAARRKENEDIDASKLPNFSRVIDTSDELVSVFNEFCALLDAYELQTGEQPQFRMYLTVNARSSQKAFYNLQDDLLRMNERLMNGHNGTQSRIQRLDTVWRSTVHSSEQKIDGRFLFDIDVDTMETAARFRDALAEETTIIEQIETPNGYHIITEKFNYTTFTPLEESDDIELKRDEELYLYSE